ncbi:hypothetical protein C2E23DRAFT_842087 [Lenzites betulinus]|nr:hypothetical protein C2E23DRAFT_842087 [Lenzites betulinus]
MGIYRGAPGDGAGRRSRGCLPSLPPAAHRRRVHSRHTFSFCTTLTITLVPKMSYTVSVFMKFALAFALLASWAQLVLGAPTASLERRDVFVPPVLYPHAGTVWVKGQRHNVTWDTTNAPVNITNKIGTILLRQGDLTTPLILADGFDILLGRIEVTVPWVLHGSDYSLVLFGDSGNFSPQFTITSSSSI